MSGLVSPNVVKCEPITGGISGTNVGRSDIHSSSIASGGRDSGVERDHIVIRTQAEFKLRMTRDHTMHDEMTGHDEQEEGKDEGASRFCFQRN